MKKLIIVILASITLAQAAEIEHTQHINADRKTGRKNTDVGNVIRIEGTELTKNGDDAAIYTTSSYIGNGFSAAALIKDAEFKTSFENFLHNDRNNTGYIDRLAKEHNGYGMPAYQSKAKIYVKAQAQGYSKYSVNGRTLEIDNYKVLAVCNSDFSKCQKVQDQNSSVIGKIKNIFN